MYVTLCDGIGRRIEAIVLALGPRHLRVVFRGRSDTVELELAGSCWLSKTGDCFEIDSAILMKSLEERVPQLRWGAAEGQ
jgi:hypothetical protein